MATRRDYKPQILTMSEEKAREFEADSRDACISITEPGRKDLPPLKRFGAVLRLQFHDLGGCLGPRGEVPQGAIQMTREDAHAILKFALDNHDRHRLVIHCHAGISRSVAVGLALGYIFASRYVWPSWYPRSWRQNRWVANPEVFKMLLDAWAEAEGKAPPVECPVKRPGGFYESLG